MKIIAMNAQDTAMITIMMLRQTAMQRLAMIVRITGGRMMTNETERIKNAIRHIQTAVDVDPWAAEIAVDAMQKQIPMKPLPKELAEQQPFGNNPVYVIPCGSCGEPLNFLFPYCPWCGQKSDMEGEG